MGDGAPAAGDGAVGVEVRRIVKDYGRGEAALRALDDVSLEIRRGEFFTLLGPSGCGKTTLLRCIAGFETPSEGRVLLGGRDITGAPPDRRPVNTVFQSYGLFPHLTVAGNVGFGPRMQGRPKGEVAETVGRVLALTRMEDFAARLPAQLSGGQQQRVALARALAPAPEVLLLDEPLSALDLKLRRAMQAELKRLQRETGITFVFVTHDQEEALTMSDRIGVMSAGRLLQVGSPRDVYDRPADRFVADFIGETNLLPAEVVAGGVRLACGPVLALDAGGRSGAVAVAVRPEQVEVGPPGSGDVDARVAETTFFGTDTHLGLDLPDGTRVMARMPSARAEGFALGDAVGLRLDAARAQVLDP